MRTIFAFLLITCMLAAAQSPRDEWLGRDGLWRDGIDNASARAMAMLASGRIDSTWLNAWAGRHVDAIEWYDGSRSAGPLALQMCLWFKERLPRVAYRLLWDKLLTVAGDDYYYAQISNNGQINCMIVRAAMGRFKSGNVRYDYIEDPDRTGDFTIAGIAYKRGLSYPIGQLGAAWLEWFILRYVDNGYLHGELFSEVYGLHFLVALVTAADPRTGLNDGIREKAEMAADLMLAEHGLTFNLHHQAGPLGRTYMQSHLFGRDNFYPWLFAFGLGWPTHYGNSGATLVTLYLPPASIVDLVKTVYPRVITSSLQDGRYVIVTDRYTLGSSPRTGDFLLELNSNDPGPYPESRPGFNFRLWMNDIVGDLDPRTCSGECYSQMGQGGYQFQNSIFIPRPALKLHEALTTNRWDFVESSGGWRFAVENGVAVATRIEVDAGAVEVCQFGIDEPDIAAFKVSVLSKAKIISMQEYITRRGDRLVIQGDGLYVNGLAFNHSLPRLRAVDAAAKVVASGDSRVFNIAGVAYDFNNWTRSGQAPPPVDVTPPAPPRGLKIQ